MHYAAIIVFCVLEKIQCSLSFRESFSVKQKYFPIKKCIVDVIDKIQYVMRARCLKAAPAGAINLPPLWREYASHTAKFLLNRFLVTSQNAWVPMNGDRAGPLEVYTRGGYGRRQIDREFSYFVGPGTHCLVQTKEKGSLLNPKARWGIHIAMYRHLVCLMCPYTKSKFRSQSFAAFRLRAGLNYAQFLGMKSLVSSRASASFP